MLTVDAENIVTLDKSKRKIFYGTIMSPISLIKWPAIADEISWGKLLLTGTEIVYSAYRV